MLEDLPGGVIAGVLGSMASFAAGFLTRVIYASVRERARVRALELHALRNQPSFSGKWLRHYYLDRDRLDDLFLATLGSRRVYLPILTKAQWHTGPFSEQELLQRPDPLPHASVLERASVLRRRRRFLAVGSATGNLWNDTILCVTSIAPGMNGQPVLTLGRATYFQYLSACGALEDETARAVSHAVSTSPTRDTFLGDLTAAAHCGLGAHGLGAQAVLAFRHNGQVRFLVQRRSLSVATYAGALAVVPVFGCEPLTDAGAQKGDSSLWHNFLREYLEELHGVAELERVGGYVDPRWFYSHPRAVPIIERRRNGQLLFEILGVGIDALNGEVNVAILAYIRDEEFAETELPLMKYNWEALDIRTQELFSEEVDAAVLADEFQPGSAFALCLARNRLRGELGAVELGQVT